MLQTSEKAAEWHRKNNIKTISSDLYDYMPWIDQLNLKIREHVLVFLSNQIAQYSEHLLRVELFWALYYHHPFSTSFMCTDTLNSWYLLMVQA